MFAAVWGYLAHTDTAPTPRSEASVCKMNGSDRSGLFTTGEFIRHRLSSLNPVSQVSVRAVFFVRSVRGNAIVE